MVEVEVLTPEAQISLQLGGRSRVQGAVEADLAEISLLRGHALRLQQPDLQGVVRSARLLRVRLHGFPQAAQGIREYMYTSLCRSSDISNRYQIA